MIILGIDPGSRSCGYGLLEINKHKIVAAGCGAITIKTTQGLSERILHIYTELNKIIEEYNPKYASIETIFYGKNIQSSLTLAHVRGAILLALAHKNILIKEFSPREIKLSAVGNGNASKKQVAYMIQNILQLKTQPVNNDAADGLAAALCLFNKEKFIMTDL